MFDTSRLKVWVTIQIGLRIVLTVGLVGNLMRSRGCQADWTGTDIIALTRIAIRIGGGHKTTNPFSCILRTAGRI